MLGTHAYNVCLYVVASAARPETHAVKKTLQQDEKAFTVWVEKRQDKFLRLKTLLCYYFQKHQDESFPLFSCFSSIPATLGSNVVGGVLSVEPLYRHLQAAGAAGGAAAGGGAVKADVVSGAW